jgi:hypothetical protein
MSNEIKAKVERSSLGTKQAREARQTVSTARAAAAVARAAQFRKISKSAGG